MRIGMIMSVRGQSAPRCMVDISHEEHVGTPGC